jgi:hypothetical protein
MNIKNITVACVALSAFSGCATITSNEMQTVSLNTKTADGQVVDKAKCTLKNDKGAWEMMSPGFVNVHRSAEDLMVECKKEGIADSVLRAISRAAGSMFGNILFGGGIGALIDHNKGTGYDYPSELPVKMGASTTVDKQQEQQQNQQQQSTSTQNQYAAAPNSK